VAIVKFKQIEIEIKYPFNVTTVSGDNAISKFHASTLLVTENLAAPLVSAENTNVTSDAFSVMK